MDQYRLAELDTLPDYSGVRAVYDRGDGRSFDVLLVPLSDGDPGCRGKCLDERVRELAPLELSWDYDLGDTLAVARDTFIDLASPEGVNGRLVTVVTLETGDTVVGDLVAVPAYGYMVFIGSYSPPEHTGTNELIEFAGSLMGSIQAPYECLYGHRDIGSVFIYLENPATVNRRDMSLAMKEVLNELGFTLRYADLYYLLTDPSFTWPPGLSPEYKEYNNPGIQLTLRGMTIGAYTLCAMSSNPDQDDLARFEVPRAVAELFRSRLEHRLGVDLTVRLDIECKSAVDSGHACRVASEEQ
ncbi:MAG: hypothetical protein GWN99_17930 [Gemmatimonadetes bacterium]|uniref:Uncharacterized protein n=1 Tax=Candidatus Kutchimonas denitrificans TaxID=3056748 RepID=A0AAE5CDE2_9BACT|nr:hypothetical protein [Gemmatimonadota bacterium]NIR75614.1 hypothetical protein [Candidatus Kutchimonas denitrificans]NIS02915.1 hypothetical protein [Gemmatimonadota bacterium]NIT68637.1 hypothetical protein [Gemmatimonadota bacterium]NIV25316.1 hypothetical protein [Gemmatimonadota bacterium]